MKTESIVTFVITDGWDEEYFGAFYHLSNFIEGCNAILLPGTKAFLHIFEQLDRSCEFRLLIHEGLRNEQGFSQLEKIQGELVSALPQFTGIKWAFITRDNRLFKNRNQAFVEDGEGVHFKFSHFNNETSYSKLPIYKKSILLGQDSHHVEQSLVATDAFVNQGESVDVVVLSALGMELAPFVKLAGLKKSKSLCEPHTVYEGQVQSMVADRTLKVLSTHQLEMGMTEASYLTTRIVTSYRPKYVIMIGVCGGRRASGVKIGDIIIPTISIAYQRGKVTGSGFQMELIGVDLNQGLYKHIDQDESKHAIPGRVLTSWNQGLGGNRLTVPEVHFAPIGCGELVVNQRGAIDKIAKLKDRKLAGVEMESYGVMRATHRLREEYDTLGLVIKAVMDLGEKKTDNDKKYAAYVSAAYAHDLITNVLTF